MKTLSKIIFLLIGWKVIGTFNFPRKCVIIAAPHTSNWDFFVGRLYAYIAQIRPKYLIKSTFFIPVLGTLFKWNGGIPVYRNSKNNVVDQMVNNFNNSNKLMIGIAPEGTRSRVKKWRTGFYHIAFKANVPIFLLALDFQKREIGIINSLDPTGNFKKDMLFIEEQFKDFKGKNQTNFNSKIF